jgi:hypothetical protein
MRLPQFCFLLASVTALVGMSLGIYMGLAHDHSLMPVHAHLNLLGWVTMFLMGLYYKTHERALGRLATLQVTASVAGYVSMMAGLATLISTGRESAMPLVIVGSLLVWLGMLAFIVIVWRTGCQRSARS